METVNINNHTNENNFDMGRFEPLSPVKPNCISIDLFELVKSKSTYSTSHVSTYDTSSIRTEDDTNKSVISENIIIKPTLSAAEELETLDDKMTLKEIISKRCHQKKTPKADKSSSTKEKLNKSENKRKLDRADAESEEVISKKEKLNNETSLSIPQLTEEKILAPKLIIKDGKVQLDNSYLSHTEPQKPLVEVVMDKKKITTSNSFKNINHSEKWTEEETRKFYRALEIFGTDFSLITKLFPNRNRNQIKNKFLKEEKVSRKKIDSVFQQQNSTKLKKIYKKAHNFLQASSKQLGDGENNLNLLSLDQVKKSETNTKLRSDSFHSTTSVDSLDMAIIEDLSDLLKQKV